MERNQTVGMLTTGPRDEFSMAMIVGIDEVGSFSACSAVASQSSK